MIYDLFIYDLFSSASFSVWDAATAWAWRHIGYHGNTPGQQKNPLNFSYWKLAEKLSRWPIFFISFLEISLNTLTY